MMNASQSLKVSSALAYASDTADRKGTTLDMKGFEGVMMLVRFATIAAGGTNSIKAQGSPTTTDGDFVDLLGTSITVVDDDDDQIFLIDIYKPIHRYIRLYVDKDAANACAESAEYIQYDAHQEPVVQTVTNLVTYELHVSPIAGTA